MPALSNPKHERFAQELAKGKSQAEAYTDAGYTGDRTAASRLSTNVNVVARVAELQGKAALRTEISIASATAHLLELAEMAKKLGDAPGIQASRASVMDACKLNGLVIDQSKRELTGADGIPLGVAVEFVDP